MTDQKKKKILIIEDEPDLLEMYKIYFERAGYEVVSASDGQISADTVKEEMPDLVLLDILLPKVDGWQVLKEVKENPETKNISVIVFSNLAQADEIKKGMQLGADEYLVKSDSTPKELLSKVEKLLSNKEAG